MYIGNSLLFIAGQCSSIWIYHRFIVFTCRGTFRMFPFGGYCDKRYNVLSRAGIDVVCWDKCLGREYRYWGRREECCCSCAGTCEADQPGEEGGGGRLLICVCTLYSYVCIKCTLCTLSRCLVFHIYFGDS